MSRGTYDPERAARSVRELAAVTDADLAGDVRAAAAAVVELAEAWRRGPGWPRTETDRAAYATAAAAGTAVAGLDPGAPLQAVVAAVSPILGQWWPDRPAAAEALRAAVEQLRVAAMHRPGLVRTARQLTSHGDWSPADP